MANRRNTPYLIPAVGERSTFVGQTGSGKTFLAQALLKSRPFVVVHDGKGTINWAGYQIVRTLAKLRTLDPTKCPRIIYRPDPEDLASEETQDAFFGWIYRRRRTALYIDEVYSCCTSNSLPFNLLACLTRGREHKVEVWASTQRPMRIPQEFLSEAENVFSFRLQMPQDRKKVEETTGIGAERIFALPKMHFLYSRQEFDRAHGPLTLKLKER